MKRTSRARLVLASVVASMLPAATPALAAPDPAVAYKKVVKTCSTYSMDGQEQKQCLADFTAAVSGVRAGYKIIVTARDPEHDAVSVIGKFKAAGSTSSKRFNDVVISYGPSQDQVKLRFRVVVKNAAGEKVFTSPPRTL